MDRVVEPGTYETFYYEKENLYIAVKSRTDEIFRKYIQWGISTNKLDYRGIWYGNEFNEEEEGKVAVIK